MGIPQTPTSPPHLYPQALQLKLYQAFIFSIPILFSIILFLLFYLFYLKRRASTLSSSQQPLPVSSTQAAYIDTSVYQVGLKKEVKDKLPTILFDEELNKRESQCCVCLGEFLIKEELLQIPSCKHVFHIQCIHNWFHSNSTCPLCRSSVIPTTKLHNQAAQFGGSLSQLQGEVNFNDGQNPQNVFSEPQLDRVRTTSTDQVVIPVVHL